MLHLLDRERTVAKPGFNRWLVPPAALAIHLSIGMAYGFSVFWLPLSQSIGITEPAPGDWKIRLSQLALTTTRSSACATRPVRSSPGCGRRPWVRPAASTGCARPISRC